MTRLMYPTAFSALAGSGALWVSGDIRAILIVDGEYTYNASHDFLNDVPAPARGSTVALTTSESGGVCDADDAVFSMVTADTYSAVIIYNHDGGADSARRLLIFDDEASNLPLTLTSTEDVDLIFSDGAAKVFRIVNA